MYEELVMRLREAPYDWPDADLHYEAADAIEKLSDIARTTATIIENEKDMRVIAKSQWIPVGERLPEPYRNVLLYSGEEFYTGYMHNDKRFTVKASSFPDRPTHWMPLPEPPKEE